MEQLACALLFYLALCVALFAVVMHYSKTDAK